MANGIHLWHNFIQILQMRFSLIIVLALLLGYTTQAQSINADDKVTLKKLESFMQSKADSIINSLDPEIRFASSKDLIQSLVIALKTKHSFQFHFDSVQISKLYSPDSTFRIFTWQVMKDYSYYRQYGAIQMKTADGSLKLFPLIDASDFTQRPTDSIREAANWIGAIYYKMILKTYNNRKYYTLLGSDENNERTNKKWIDVLSFDEQGKPQFGRSCFVYPNDGIKPSQPCYRFCIEYKKNGGVRLMYNEKLDEIIFDHIVSENNEIQNKASLVPYGDYEGFRWNNGKWYFTAQPFDAIPFEEKPKSILKPLDEIEKDEKKNKKKNKVF
ncbi:MAG: hypothetical protein NTZ59_07705 [Bacteroidetes bacterium]|nr:hypothetical protein [Bacteroidota bacterium]